jgi:hypothetical protein
MQAACHSPEAAQPANAHALLQRLVRPYPLLGGPCTASHELCRDASPHAPRPCLRAASATLARASSFESSSTSSFTHRLLSPPRPHKVRTTPFPARAAPAPRLRTRLHRRAQRSCAFVRPPPPPPTSRPARHSAPTTPRGCPLRARDVGGCVLAQRPGLRRACWHNAPARFSTASGADARCSSAPSAPCRLNSVQVRHGTAGRGRVAGDRCALAPNSGLRVARCLPRSTAR